MYPGPTCAMPTGKSPDICLTGPTEDWHTNKGTGGGFTENGALTDAASQPGQHLQSWAQVGNDLFLTSHTSAGMARLTDTTIAYTHSTADEIRTYSWDGTDWTQIGNAFSVGIDTSPVAAALNSTTIVETSGADSGTSEKTRSGCSSFQALLMQILRAIP